MAKHKLELGEADASALIALASFRDVLSDMAVALSRAGVDPDDFLGRLEVDAVQRMERHLKDKGRQPTFVHGEVLKHVANAIHHARLTVELSKGLSG